MIEISTGKRIKPRAPRAIILLSAAVVVMLWSGLFYDSKKTEEVAIERRLLRDKSREGRCCFAYLSIPHRLGATPQLISNYPSAWTTHYLQSHYERFDPVIIQALGRPEPFEWGLEVGTMTTSRPQQELLEEAAKLAFATDSQFRFTMVVARSPQ
jgi:hypothetical protein